MTDKEKKKRRRVFNIPCWCCAHKVRALGFVIAGTFLIPPPSTTAMASAAAGHRQRDCEHHHAAGLWASADQTDTDQQATGSKYPPRCSEANTQRISNADRSTESLREAAIATTHNRVISGCLKIPNTAAPT